MHRKQLLTGIFSAVGMMILILDGQTALEGARTGIELCIKTVIPSLFPFFLLSILLTNALTGVSLSFLVPLGKLCGIPKGAEPILIAGFLGGYPVGAQSVAASWRAGQLHRKDAERMLSFCSNAGPAFLFGMVSSLFSSLWIPWLLWAIHIVSAILVSLIIPADSRHTVQTPNSTDISLSMALRSAIQVMATVCGWVTLFRVIVTFLNRWVLWLLPAAAQVAVIGILELSNGCCELISVSEPGLRFILCSGMLACGGLCVTMQTRSVTTGLSMKYYYCGKLLQTMFSLFLCCAVVFHLWLPCAAVLLLFVVMLRKRQKRSSIPAAVGV